MWNKYLLDALNVGESTFYQHFRITKIILSFEFGNPVFQRAEEFRVMVPGVKGGQIGFIKLTLYQHFRITK